MAYQNVGTPRFYINELEWLDSIGAISLPSNHLRTLPVEPTLFSLITVHGLLNIPYTIKHNVFIAVLGHRLQTELNYFVIKDDSDSDYGITTDYTNVVNFSGHQNTPEFDGFTIVEVNLELNNGLKYVHQMEGMNVDDATVGSAIVGTYYDMPHSPDLSLTMSREYGGTKTIETKGGASLSNSMWNKPPMWGEGGAWELYNSDTLSQQMFSRGGRRVWDLSFSYLDDGDVFGSNQSLSILEADAYFVPSPGNLAGLGYDSGDIHSNSGNFAYHFLSDPNFFSKVIQKTGGKLPFLFQPDSNNNHTDNFAICKFDQNSFKFTQTAPGLYSCKLKIREVW